MLRPLPDTDRAANAAAMRQQCGNKAETAVKISLQPMNKASRNKN
jgi:hypothetical protein